MHVMILTYEFHPTAGGVGNSTAYLARALKQHLGAKVTIVDGGTSWMLATTKKVGEWEGSSVFRLKYTGLPEERFLRQSVRSAIFFIQFFFAAMRLKPDVILSQRVYDLGLFAGIVAALIRCRSVTYAHGPDEIGHAEILPFRRSLNRLAGKLNDVMVATNSHHAEYLAAQTGKSVAIIPNISYPQIRHPNGIARKGSGHTRRRYRLLFVGRLCREYGYETKGLSCLLNAMPEMGDVDLEIVGDGPLREHYEDAAAILGIVDRVKFYGRIHHDEVGVLMANADALVVPSLFEGCSLTVLEAMRSGLLVLATPVGGLLDLVKEGETGFRILPSNSASIVEQVHRARTRPSEVERVVKNASRFVAERTSSEVVAEEFRPLLEQGRS